MGHSRLLAFFTLCFIVACSDDDPPGDGLGTAGAAGTSTAGASGGGSAGSGGSTSGAAGSAGANPGGVAGATGGGAAGGTAGNAGGAGGATGGTVSTGGVAGATGGAAGSAGATSTGGVGGASGGTTPTGGAAGTSGTGAGGSAGSLSSGGHSSEACCGPRMVVGKNQRWEPVDALCGATTCPDRAHSTKTCTGGACAYTCDDGWGDCDTDQSNGCETSLFSRGNCGTCGSSCGGTQYCSETLGCVDDCPSPELESCNYACMDQATSPNHCAACGPCSEPPNGSPQCAGPTCGVVCDPGFTNCGGTCVDLQSTAASCGSCSTKCPVPPGGAARCDAGSCELACPPGLLICAGSCVDPRLNEAHCGGCNSPCNGTGVAGRCEAAFDPNVSAVALTDLTYHQGRLYWIDGNDIKVSQPDGSGISVLIAAQQGAKSFILRGNYAYYIAALNERIYRVALTGGSRELIAIDTPKSLTVSDNFVHWESTDNVPKRAPVGGGAVESISDLYGAVYNRSAIDDDTLLVLNHGELSLLAFSIPRKEVLTLLSYSYTNEARLTYNDDSAFVVGEELTAGVGARSMATAYDLSARRTAVAYRQDHGYLNAGQGDADWMYYYAEGYLDPEGSVYRTSMCNLPREKLHTEAKRGGYYHATLGPDFVYLSGRAGVIRVPR